MQKQNALTHTHTHRQKRVYIKLHKNNVSAQNKNYNNEVIEDENVNLIESEINWLGLRARVDRFNSI